MKAYNELVNDVLLNGSLKEARQGVQTQYVSGARMRIDLREGFPLLTTKYINFDHIVTETIWYLLGTDKITFLKANNVNIWNSWADENDSIGKTYGYQWRNFNDQNIDQIQQAIDTLKTNPTSRRIIITGWNPAQLQDMALPPCLMSMQFVSDGKTLDLVVYQRSADIAVGVPYDTAEMALLQHMVAAITGLKPRFLTFQYGDAHIYVDHIESLKKQMLRPLKELPQLFVNAKQFIEQYTKEDFMLLNYNPDKKIKYEVFV